MSFAQRIFTVADMKKPPSGGFFLAMTRRVQSLSSADFSLASGLSLRNTEG